MSKPLKFIKISRNYAITHIRATFCLLSYPKNRLYVVQFSLKDPWFLPRIDRNYLNNPNNTLIGWLFFYVGVFR